MMGGSTILNSAPFAVTPPLWAFPIGSPLAPPPILTTPPGVKALLAQLGPEAEVESEPEPDDLESLLCRLEDGVIRLMRQVGGGSWKGSGGVLEGQRKQWGGS